MTEAAPIKKTNHRIQTIDMLSPSLIAGIRELAASDQTAPTPIDARRAASTFLDQKIYKLEQERIFRRSPVAVTLTAMLPEAGAYMAHDGYGLPLLVTRGKDGKVRVFLNVCQHRGSKIVEDCEAHKGGRLSCPYHAWTYGLDGKLIGVPREETFKNLVKAERGLAELPSLEAGGFIWAILDPQAKPDFSELVPELIDDLDSLDVPTAHVYGHRTIHLKANWKLVIEPFFEPYHVQRLHAKSLAGIFADVTGVAKAIGPHNRQISGKANFESDLFNAVGENVHKTITLGYQLFPNTIIVTSPYYISIMIMMPDGIDKTIVNYFMITRTPPDSEKAKDIYSRSYEMIQNVFGNEDFRAAELSQAGIASGALKDLIYCGLESSIPDFYKVLDAHLAR